MPQKKYPLELRERAVRMVLDALEAGPGARRGIFRRIGDQLGVNPETLRSWVNQDQVDVGTRPGTTTADAQRIKDLEKENRELRRANQILKSASLDSKRQRNTMPDADVRSRYGQIRSPRTTTARTPPSVGAMETRTIVQRDLSHGRGGARLGIFHPSPTRRDLVPSSAAL